MNSRWPRPSFDVGDNDLHHIATYRDSGRIFTHVPLRPEWWDDSAAAERRQRVVSDFDPTDLTQCVEHIEKSASDVSGSAMSSLIRRCLAAWWLLEVADAVEPTGTVEDTIRLWQRRATRTLVLSTWGQIASLPASDVLTALCQAASDRFDVEEIDEQ